MSDTLSTSMINEVVDDSHKYTTVYTEERRGPGNAHHKYAIKDKEGKLLGWLNFQDGPIKEAGINGVMDENLLAIVIDRLTGFQEGSFQCRENALALTRIQEALLWLEKRTKDREKRGVEGTNKK